MTAPETLAVRILVVDDHVDTCRAIAIILDRQGHQVDCANSIAEATKKLNSRRFDLLISDLSLPDGDGVDLMRDVAGLVGTRGIALTGHGRLVDRERAIAGGFLTVLLKPFDMKMLVDSVDSVLGLGQIRGRESI
jgi:DNA-binding NtrC family response regulator